MKSPRSRSLADKLKLTSWTMSGTASCGLVAFYLLGQLTHRSTLICERQSGQPPDCRIVTDAGFGQQTTQQLPNGQLLRARLEPDRNSFSRASDDRAVILETGQGEIYFSPKNTSGAGVLRYFDQEINAFLRSPQATSLTVQSRMPFAVEVAQRLIFAIAILAGLNAFRALWIIWFTQQSEPRSVSGAARQEKAWSQTSDRLKNLLEPPPQESHQSDRQD